MNVALRPSPALAPAGEQSAPIPPRIARVETFADMATAEPHWRALERASVLATPYQRYEFLSLWQQHVGAPDGILPFIAVAFDAVGAPLCLLPLGRRVVGSLRVLEFLGGKHVNFNVALWRRDATAAMTAETLERILARLTDDADALVLINQPVSWNGTPNPLALLPHQASPNFGFSGPLIPDFDALLQSRTSSDARKKMRRKERLLAEFGPVKFTRVSEPAGIARLLDVFFQQKSARMRAAGIKDAFADVTVRRFIEAISAAKLSGGAPLVELYALTAGDTVVAMWSGMVSGGRFCAMFNSITDGPMATPSPGEQLLVHLVRDCCDRGLTTFDLGTGTARYKSLFCPNAEPLFDSFLPLTSAGRLHVVIARSIASLKRGIKQNAFLWSLVCSARRFRARKS